MSHQRELEKSQLPGPDMPFPAPKRRKLWEVEMRFHCSIIGTCVTLPELRRISKKAGIVLAQERKVTDYMLHVGFVNIAAENIHPTRLLQKFLDKKYAVLIRRLQSEVTREGQAALWNECLESGEVAGAFWAITTATHIYSVVQEDVYGKVHMLSHLSGASVRVEMQLLTTLKKRVPALEKELRDSQEEYLRRVYKKDKALTQLEAEVEALKRSEQQYRKQLDAVHVSAEELPAQLDNERRRNDSFQSHLDQLMRSNYAHERNSLKVTEQLAASQAEISALQQTNRLLESLMEKMLVPECGECDHQDYCDTSTDLKGRCVLYVGGRSRQYAHFRALVEKHNGAFLFHDGGQEDSRAQLGRTLSRADLVICPLDCVSHDAVNRVKKYCVQQEKQLMLVSQASLSSLASGLRHAVVNQNESIITLN